MELRTAGTRFVTDLHLRDPRAALAHRLAPGLLQFSLDYDTRAEAFDALAAGRLQVGNQPQGALSVYDPRALRTLRDIAKLSDGVVIRSFAERERISRYVEHVPPYVLEIPHADFEIAAHPNDDAATVVIWAPALDATQTALLAFALEELHCPVWVVCSEGSIDGLHARFLSSSSVRDATEVLAGASVVVDACFDHAGNAIALTRAGFTVTAATTSGVQEFLDDVIVFDPWNIRSVFSAVVTAMGAELPVVREVRPPMFTPQSVREEGPRATMVIRTYNRPDFLRRSLASLARQTYRNLEIIVVNDAGEDVGDIVAQVPHARYLNLATNRGSSAAGNEALRVATGDYIGFLDDDDLVLPEHVSVLVDALERSAASVAYSDTLAAHFERMADGAYRPTGYLIFLDAVVEPTDFYVTDAIGPMSAMVKRSAAIAVGGYDEAITHAHDWEYYLNLLQHFEFIHVPYVTGVYSIRHDGTNMMSYAGEKIADAMDRLLERYPLPHRPILEHARRESVARFRASGNVHEFPHPPLSRSLDE